MEINVRPVKTEVMGLTKRSENLVVNFMLKGSAVPHVDIYISIQDV